MRTCRTATWRWGLVALIAGAALLSATTARALGPGPDVALFMTGHTVAPATEESQVANRAKQFQMHMDLARVYCEYKQYVKARQHYLEALQKAATNLEKSDLYMQMARMAKVQRKHELALARMQEAVGLAPDPEQRCRIYPELILLLKQKHKWEEAEQTILRFMAEAKGEQQKAKAGSYLVQLYEAQGRLADLAEQLEQERRRKPQNIPVLEMLAGVYDQTRMPERAAGIYEELVKLKPDDALLMARLARSYRLAGRLDAAAGVYQRVMDMESDNEDFDPDAVRRAVAKMYAAANQYEKAVPWVDAMATNPRGPVSAVTAKADLYALLKMLPKGVECLDVAVKMRKNPEHRARLLFKAASLLKTVGDKEAAEKRLQLIMADPEMPRMARIEAQKQLDTLDGKVAAP